MLKKIKTNKLKAVSALLVSTILVTSGCAERSVNIINPQGKVVGECMAGYDWHFYGLQDSIDYMLYICAKEHIATGHTLSDNSIVTKDYTLPAAPTDKVWSRALAMSEFKAGRLTEQKLGHLLAQLEWTYVLKQREVEAQLANNEITPQQANALVKAAKAVWQGE